MEFQLAESGSTWLLIAGREHVLPARRLAVFWAGQPHQVLAAEARECWFLRVPLDWFIQLPLPPPFVRGVLEGRVLFEPDFDHYECDQFRLRLWSESVGRGEALRQAAALEVEARLWRLAATLPSAWPELALNLDKQRRTANKALLAAAMIARRHAEPLSIDGLGAAVGLHPSHLMKVFRRKLGTTVLAYLTQHRLAHALRLLCLGDLPLSRVAAESGFGSTKRLAVTFREAFKDSPAAFRRRVRVAGTCAPA